MKQLARTVLVSLCALVASSVAGLAGSYTVHLDNGEVLETRYPPQFDEDDVQLLTSSGHWMTVPQERVTQVRNDSPGGQVRRIDSKTILIGWAPNDAPAPRSSSASRARAPAAESAVDSAALVLSFLALQKPLRMQDFSVTQFVEPEDVSGGIPMSGIFYFRDPAPEPLEDLYALLQGSLLELQGIPTEDQRLMDILQQSVQAVPPGSGFEVIPGLPRGSGFEKVQGLPPGGFQIVQGIPGRWLSEAASGDTSATGAGSSPD